MARLRRGWRSDELRNPACRGLSSGWCLHRPHPQRCQTSRTTGRAGHEVRVCDQPELCQGSRPRGPAHAARPCRRGDRVRRRAFITLVGGAAASSMSWPLAARAQQRERMRRIGVLHTLAAADPHGQARNTAFLQALAQSGWIEGRSAQFDIRWSAADADRIRQYVAEVVALAPDVILASGSFIVAPLLQATRSVPIVFALVPDPVGSGFVDSLARPGGNATGFMLYEYSTYGKYVELLKEVAPDVMRMAVLRDAGTTGVIGQFGAIQTMAAALRLEVTPINVRDAGEIDNAVTAFARAANGGLLVTGSPLAFRHRSSVIALAARHKLPAVYYERVFVTDGGLISYGADFIDQYRLAAGYVDRILKGERPANLPVQAPTKYELVINLKTARALGLEMPTSLLARADEVIE